MNAYTRILTFVFLAFASNGFAETATPILDENDNLLLLYIGVSVAFLFLFLLGYLLTVLFDLVHVYNQLVGQGKEITVFKLEDSVPIEREQEILMAHEYDGIRELDNNMPAWWLYLFYATIIFAGIYLWFYHVYNDGNIQAKEYEMAMVQAEEEMKLMADRVNETTVTMLTDKAKIANGEAVFQKSCVACHGKLGEGGVGPNLTDDYWLHGGDIKSIFKTIKYGVPTKGMISWQTQLGASQMQEVASYIATLKGTNPPNGKEPQGERSTVIY